MESLRNLNKIILNYIFLERKTPYLDNFPKLMERASFLKKSKTKKLKKETKTTTTTKKPRKLKKKLASF